MVHAGLTGGIGSGKSAVAGMFAALGAVVLDADGLGRELTGPGSEAARAVESALGPGLLTSDGSLDRAATAHRVFGDEEARRRLEALLHPRIVALRRGRLARLRGMLGDGAVVLSEAALIFEAGTRAEFDCVVLVTAPREVRLARLAARGLAREEAERRMAAQWEEARKVPLADYVVDNGGSLDATRAQAARIWDALVGRARRG